MHRIAFGLTLGFLSLTLAGCHASSTLSVQLRKAVRSGDLATAKAEIERTHPNLAETEEGGWTMLHRAAYGGSTQIVALLQRMHAYQLLSRPGFGPAVPMYPD